MDKRIGLMGGTFDPPHIGHAILAETARISLKLDEVWWLPNQVPPHKEKKSVTSDEERINMVEMICEKHGPFVCNLIEFERKGPSYTADTLKLLKDQHPTHDFYFIIGGDSVDALHTWRDIETIGELVTFAWMKRPGYRGEPQIDVPMTFIEGLSLDISSTAIRQAVKAGTLNSFLLTENVASYIKENNLYE
ncbi:nicotinate-nucleotide adenylyltransferase [Bacillus sp. H-16]|uniref:nicotinate-nucleotide adenylyltransferase n=1 Tax=Alteribacter salitolerans TaxID=2912333 RepID=UPI0019657A04|nr:nicotinate-nucleotide adenylyltransferase [Alteribacter salitolerans]MBM7097139.1 nicotinate-nucleotide adenylyltransferase [Alteribacter salitolerans]